ncbi:MAG: hypothetical protein H8D37_05685, partial [Chloroflexi bacterium]|nr:hypothetical protein [Chloroflexota bacterium]
GQIDQGGHGGQDAVVLLEPFVLVGAGVVPGEYGDVQMVDVAPTLAALLGANIPASSQGQVLTQMLTFSPEQVQFIESALESQQSQLMDAYQKAIGIQVDVKDDESPVAKYQGALESARGMRLKTERVQRIVLGVGVFLLTVIILYLKRSSDLLWLIGGGVLYLVVFHLRYALLDGRAYSLSSVYSADTLIAYCGTTALIALFIAWLVSSLGLKAFRRGSGEASWLTLELTIITIFLLALPVLWYVMFNGVLVTWTLPDQASMFLAFIAILQILVVSISGLILTGLSALIARYANL